MAEKAFLSDSMKNVNQYFPQEKLKPCTEQSDIYKHPNEPKSFFHWGFFYESVNLFTF